ncbi:hypothetical protein GCM10009609_36690 [Pseudonocardia aurantiaca]
MGARRDADRTDTEPVDAGSADIRPTGRGSLTFVGTATTVLRLGGFTLLEPATVVPVHYDDYGVFRSPLVDFVAEMRRRGHDGRLRPVVRGDTVELTAFPHR